tara:strand:+ start:799 stop:1260 length:462 start_codon:yes stop_codon:yes gene_type:complete
MKPTAALACLPLVICIAADRPSDRQALTDEIEQTVRLPDGAQPLTAYGRNYAFDGQDKVVATYLIPSLHSSQDEGCEVMLDNFDSRPCTQEEIKELAEAEASMTASQTPAGEIRWHESPKSLPFINDGGCAQVNVEYDVAAHRILAVECNGEA